LRGVAHLRLVWGQHGRDADLDVGGLYPDLMDVVPVPMASQPVLMSVL